MSCSTGEAFKITRSGQKVAANGTNVNVTNITTTSVSGSDGSVTNVTNGTTSTGSTSSASGSDGSVTNVTNGTTSTGGTSSSGSSDGTTVTNTTLKPDLVVSSLNVTKVLEQVAVPMQGYNETNQSNYTYTVYEQQLFVRVNATVKNIGSASTGVGISFITYFSKSTPLIDPAGYTLGALAPNAE
ncbi:MAG: hypothetical protein AAB874_01210, partial [Patescibacteria group bacterium]